MAAKLHLSVGDKNFFKLVQQAALVNPFTEERSLINRQLSGLPDDRLATEHNQKGVYAVRRRVKRLEDAGRENFNDYVSQDKRLMKKAYIFDFFHCFVDHFDRHIQKQLNSGDQPVTVPFADEAFAYLDRKGYTAEEKLRAIGLTFQVWRAFYFIARNLVGRGACMRKLRECLWNNVFTHSMEFYTQHLWQRMEDFSTIIAGETGTGKGTAAMAIGRSGYIPFDEKKKSFKENFARSFVTLNLSQFPEALIESELFGHQKGAFTGAVEEHQGLFQRCSKYGSIFLDEIGEVSHPIQIKLLKVLEERVFSPVGSHRINRFDGRVIAATNRPIDQLVADGIMRTDFYYRLCSDVITVPPLRDRLKDDPAELDDLLTVIVTNTLGTDSADIVGQLRQLIDKRLGPEYDWPGNVRELAQCVRRLLLNQTYTGLKKPSGEGAPGAFNEEETGEIDAQSLVKKYCYSLYQRYGTYGEVARRTKLDRRTVKKYIIDYTHQAPDAN
ncbi:Two-component system response regulator protein [Olavius sp. associated proteobacterium Delta 1]|nr:Two-component system response regulator protein [Olavius sp. associated proteobacterium Delta 1]